MPVPSVFNGREEHRSMRVFSWNCSRLLWRTFTVMAVATPANLRAQTISAAVGADPSRSGTLFEELVRMDSSLFDASFVSCDAEVANAIFADDMEFYHDQISSRAARRERILEGMRFSQGHGGTP